MTPDNDTYGLTNYNTVAEKKADQGVRCFHELLISRV
jgi:hypothetical protein